MRWGSLALPLIAPTALLAQSRIGSIDFFGYQGIDVQAILRALPFHEGDAFRSEIRDEARSTVKRITGHDATDVAAICCTRGGDMAIFVGLPGTSSQAFTFEAAPQGLANPPAELVTLYTAMIRATEEAVKKSLTEEDGAPGYRLSKEPGARAAELAVRAYALKHEDEILHLLTSSGDAAQRAMAADALGFGARSPRQIAALVRALRDPNPEVRNNSTRALGEMLRADPTLATQIPPDHFIQMIHSGIWTDRNKASLVLFNLTQSRDPQLLGRLKSEAGDALQEMASWRAPRSWAFPARVILGRIEGQSEISILFFGGLRLSLAQGAALAAFILAALTLLWTQLTSGRENWAVALLAPIPISCLLFWAVVRLSGAYVSDYGSWAFAFILAWYLAGAAASSAIVIYRHKRLL